MLTQLRDAKYLPTALIVAGLIALPTAADAYAQSTTSSKTATDHETENAKTPDGLAVANEEPIVTESKTPIETETEIASDPALTTVTEAQAQPIAETEHPESVVVDSKAKTIDSQTVYVFLFADHWKVAVRASDGTVIRVQDGSDKDHDCLNRHKETGVHGNDKRPTMSSLKKELRDDRGSHRHHRGDDRR